MTEAIGLLILVIIIFLIWLLRTPTPRPAPRPTSRPYAEVAGSPDLARPVDPGPTRFNRPRPVIREQVLPSQGRQRGPLSIYNFRGIVSPSDVVRIKDGVTELDLHELRVLEAKQVTLMFLKQSRGRYRRVQVITGRGLHSFGGTPRIKPEVETLLRNTGYKFKEMYEGGCLEVKL